MRNWKDIEEAAIVIIAMVGFLATNVWLTVFQGPHPTTFLGWFREITTNTGLSMFWPIYVPVHFILGW